MHTEIALILLLVAARGAQVDGRQQMAEVHDEKFYYFGFGSNMLAKRIHIQNPSAQFVGPATLAEHRLDFATIADSRWNGAVATIVPTREALTWGTLWDIELTNLADIDNQEGVHENLYRPITVHVKLHGNGTEIAARAYALVKQPEGNVHGSGQSVVPEDRKPSKTYLQVLVKGAIESGIPQEYVNWLKQIKHNNKTAKDMERFLELESVKL
ncbi:PREDICTED: gamma-glutamylcyclotransferase-like isoform X1 [Drosophila arizonae]|uniref:gamma-glutamylcyclotransferase n=1 Tax=Drosophila arizonae TaxID=7263 RepID=A0ABM1P1N0_DROAR|nr:PREDICTED: gamma-glutamylcyclotransferase-like isoform X1 [Drosophila arizonae]